MKKFFLIALCVCTLTVFSQENLEKEVTTKIDEVLVFLEEAQVHRPAKNVVVNKGTTELKFPNLSPFIDAKSIQVKMKGDAVVLAVNHRKNYLKEETKSDELIDLENEIKKIDIKIKEEKIYLNILSNELSFLEYNKKIGGEDTGVDIADLEKAVVFYATQLKKLKFDIAERTESVTALQIKRQKYGRQIKTLVNQESFGTGEIVVKVLAKKQTSVDIDLSYLVGGVRWYPTYDIRSNTVNEPIMVRYKANIVQESKVDWNNVKLTISTTNPNLSGIAPKLQTHYLDYYSKPPVYSNQRGVNNNEISGTVLDSDGVSLPGVNVSIEGTTIGTSTDFDGNYTITVPNPNNQRLIFSYIGFEDYINVASRIGEEIYLYPNRDLLDEVVIVGYGSNQSSLDENILEEDVVYDMRSSRDKKSVPKSKQKEQRRLDVSQTQKQLSVEFEIEEAYTIKSENKPFVVEIGQYNVDTKYQYYTVPKIEKTAFLNAKLFNYEQYNFLSGEANVFFEDVFIGKTIIDMNTAVDDMLDISLGQDKSIVIDRVKIDNLEENRFIGSKKVQNLGYKNIIKNNKNQLVDIVVLDQVPVSGVNDIIVEIENETGANFTKKTGEVKWQIKLTPNENKELDLIYSVKYPKDRRIYIE